MTSSVISRLTLSFVSLLLIFCCSCQTKQKVTSEAVEKPTAVETKPAETKQVTEVQKPAEPLEVKPAAVQAEPNKPAEVKPVTVTQEPNQPRTAQAPPQPSDIVAKIGDCVITRGELEEKMMYDLRPYPGKYSGKTAEPDSAEKVLMDMIVEKAMIMDGREKNYLDDEIIHSSVQRLTDRKLISLLLGTHLGGKLNVISLEIDEAMKADPKLDKAGATEMLKRSKSNKLMQDYYNQIHERRNVKKLNDNIAKAAEIHKRLRTSGKTGFILESQVREDVTPEEKGLVLAEYDGGKVTLKDWFGFLCEMSPPSRPPDLNSPAGVDRLLDRALRTSLFVTEALSLGLDKDKELCKQVKEYEDRRLLGKAREEKTRDIVNQQISNDELIAYFNKDRKGFGRPDAVTIDQIWCQDHQTAEKVKQELDSGKNFELVKQEYSLEKKGTARDVYLAYEGIFFKDILDAEPNTIIGPMKGFYENTIKWRLVKIIEKKPAEQVEYSDNIKNTVRSKIISEQAKAVLEQYRKELLEKYPYEIYQGKIKGIDLLDIP